LADEVGQGPECFRDVGVGAGPVYLVEVDVIGAQASERVLDLGHDPAPGSTAVVGDVVVHGHEELGREDDVAAAPL
jgi:hypothetical protein